MLAGGNEMKTKRRYLRKVDPKLRCQAICVMSSLPDSQGFHCKRIGRHKTFYGERVCLQHFYMGLDLKFVR